MSDVAHGPLVTCKFYFCSFHLSVSIDVAVAAVLGVFTTALKLLPKFRANGGSLRENLALQNVQVLSLIHISEPTRPLYISYAVFCLKK